MEFNQEGVPQVAAVIPGNKPATSACFHADGKHLFVASEADSRLRVIDCQKGVSEQSAIRCEREGVYLAEPTHHTECVLFAGKGTPGQPRTHQNAVNYLSLYDNKILRKFRGHSDQIAKISLCPADDCFLTSSKDRTVRLWTLQQAGCLAQMDLPVEAVGTPLAVFDSTGLVFGVTAAMANGQGHYIHLYDARNYSSGAFAEMKVDQASLNAVLPPAKAQAPWTNMTFNGSGNQILISGGQGLALTLDGFEGTVKRTFTEQSALCSCFTPDDKYVLTGNEDGSISCWNVDSGILVKKLEGHPNPVTCVVASPKTTLLASCCTNTALWLWK